MYLAKRNRNSEQNEKEIIVWIAETGIDRNGKYGHGTQRQSYITYDAVKDKCRTLLTCRATMRMRTSGTKCSAYGPQALSYVHGKGSLQ